MKYISYLLAILGIYFFVFACQPPPCTDDGCPEFNELTSPPENLDVVITPTKSHDIELHERRGLDWGYVPPRETKP